MTRDNGESQGLWADEHEVVALGPVLAPTTTDANGAGTRKAPRRPDRADDRGPSASELTADRLVVAIPVPHVTGWRRTVYRLTGGLIAPGPSERERRQRDLVARAKTPIVGCRRVAFVSRKGGVGKTTTCLLVGHTFASLRGDRVIALDANPDAGTLGYRLRRETTESVATLLRDGELIGRYADIRGYSSQAPSRLEVIAGDDLADTTTAIQGSQVRLAVGLLGRHYNLICLDTAAGVLGSAVQGVLASADQLVIVSSTSLDGARGASSTLDWLDSHGHHELVRSSVAVVNGVRRERSAVDLDGLASHFADRCRACVVVPWDAHLETGADASLDALASDTRQAYLELAAAIASGFAPETERR